MAITAATRQDIIELCVIANNEAPGTTLLASLIAESEAGKSLTQIAETLAARSGFTAKYPSIQTSTEFATEFLNTLLPEVGAAFVTAGIPLVTAHINGGGSIGALIAICQDVLSSTASTDADLGTSVSNFNNKYTVAAYHTVTLELADGSASVLSGVTSTATTVTTAKAAADLIKTPATVAAAVATFALASDVSTVSEGGDVVYTLTTTNVAAGTQYSYVVSGVNSSDLSAGTLTGTATIDTDGKATISVGLKNDTTTEGAETMVMTVAGKTASVSVTDSSTTAAAVTAAVATYALTSDVSTVSEGGDVVFTLATTNVTAGTEFAYVISGINSSDLSAGSLTGLAEVDSDGKSTVSVGLKNDTTTEGAETMVMTVAGKTASVSVTDSSTTAAAATAATATYALTANATSVNEGATAYYTLATTNVAAGTQYSWSVTGVSSADVVGGVLAGTATIDANGDAVIGVSLVNDTLTEGAETMTLTVAEKSTGVTVADTSLTAAAVAATTYTLTSTSPQVTEGDSGDAALVFTITLSAAADAATVVNYETLTTGTATAGTDFTAKAGTVTLGVGQTSATVSVTVAGDTSFESDETVKIKFSGTNITADVTGTGTITNDDTDPDTVAQAKTLTTGTDSFTTGSGADTFDASTSGTLDTVDTIVGGAGADVLTVAIANESIRPSVSGVETVKLTAAANTGTLDTRDMSDVTNYDNESSAGNIVLNYVSTIPTLTLNTATADTTVNFTDAATVGTADSMTINVNNATGTVNVTLDDQGGTVNELETVVVNSTSLASTLATLVTDGVETSAVTVTGDADLTISSLDALVGTLTSTAFTGDLSVTSTRALGFIVTTGAGADTITASSAAGAHIVNTGAGADAYTGGSSVADNIDLGTGNDTINIAHLSLTSVDTIAGGAGTDTLAMSNDSTVVDADFTLITGVEKFNSGNNDLNLTLGAASLATGITTVTGGTGTNAITIGAGHTANLTVALVAGTDTVTGTAYTGVLTVTAAAGSLNADTIIGGTGTTDNLIITAGTVNNTNMTGISAIETYTISGTTANASITIDELNVADGKTLHLDGSSLTTGILTAVMSDDNNGIITVTGGAAADAITGSSSDLGDTLIGGAGNDTFTFATGDFTSLDTVQGGAGTDILTFNDAETVIDSDFTNVTSVETYQGNAGASTITLGPLATAAGIVNVLTGATTASTLNIPATHTGDLVVTSQIAGESILSNAAYAGKLTVKIDADILNGGTITAGVGTTDVLSITADGANLAADDLDTVTLFETVDVAFNAAFQITSAVEQVATGKSIAWTASGMTSAALTLILSEETDTTSSQTVTLAGTGDHVITLGSGTDTVTSTGTGAISVTATAGANIITTGTGADIITLGTGADNINPGTGLNIIKFANANIGSTDTITGGALVDTLFQTDTGGGIVDADFTNMTSVEKLTADTDMELDVTLGSAALAAGLVTINLTDTTAGTETITVGAGYTGTLTVDFDTDAIGLNSVIATASAATIIVTAADEDLDETSPVITGGTGTSDEVKITSTADNTILTANWTAVEKITTVASAGGITITTAAGNVAAGETLTINATSMTDEVFTFTGTAETATTPGHFVITTAGTAAHIITLGSGNDSYTSTNTAGTNTVTATAGTNTITTGDGADAITLGTGVDNVTGGAGNDTISVLTANLVSTDTIAGGTGTDILSLLDASTTVDADFTLITSVETFQQTTAGHNTTLTLGAASNAAGIVTITGGTGTNSITVGAGHTTNLTVALAAGTDTVNAAAYTGALTVTAAIASISSDTITGGTGSDTLTITGGAATITAAEMANVTLIETYKSATDAAFDITLHDNNVAAGGSLTINATSAATTVVKIDASAETDGTLAITTLGTKAHIIVLGSGSDTYTSTNTAGINTVTATAGNNTITTAAGADIITLGSGSDTVTSGDGIDIIKTISANLNQNDIINAGDGVDLLKITGDSTIIDTDFTGITNLEHVTAASAVDLVLTLGALAQAAGVTTVTFLGTGTGDSLTVTSAFTNALAVDTGPDAAVNTVDASASTSTITLNVQGTDLDDSANALTGGSGGSDEIKITVTAADDAINATDLGSVAGFEKITTVSDLGTLTLTTAAGNVAAGATLTINATSLVTESLIFVGTAETATTPGHFVITAAGTKAHSVTLGSGNDSYTSTSTGVDTVVATAGTNTISTGAGADSITSGSGADTMTSASGANILILTTAALTGVSNVRSMDTITDFTTATWDIDLDILDSGMSGAYKLLGNGAIADAAADDTALVTITGPTDLGTIDHGAANVLIINLTATISSASELETALEFGGIAELTADGVWTAGDRMVVVYDNGVSTWIATVAAGQGAADNGYFGVGTMVATNLVQLTGVASSTSVAATDIDFI